ncbi:MAG: polyprenyl synthetase family protein [Fuerstiella sp.]
MNSSTLTSSDLKSQLQQHLGEELSAVTQILSRQMRSGSRFVSDITEHVARFQGKQIRPLLLLLTQRMICGRVTEEARMLAAAVEMIHTATLVHDDVIDEAETRRHVATVHRRWDTETSVLLGDYLFSKSFHLAASTGDAEACRLIGRATDRTCEGELNQIAARLEQSTSEFDYFRIIRDKTGQLFALSCRLGARAAGASSHQVMKAARFGMRLGMAFQVADDILDLTERAELTGKDAGNDLQNGRMTLPLLRAIRLAETSNEAQELRRLLTVGDTAVPDIIGHLPAVQRGIRSAGDTAMDLATRAVADLHQFSASHDQRLLEMLAMFAVRRRQ